MIVQRSGAQRASRHHRSLRVAIAAFAAFLAFGGLLAQPQTAAASGIKVVIVVGATGSKTSEYIGNANYIASRARAYGATVYKVYSPYATWSRVKQVARGANLFVYLGHGNGWPSPYAPFQKVTKDGLGLNASGGNGNYNTKYYGENSIAADLDLAPNSAVLFFRLCYASGNSEPGRATPNRSTAHQRVDNYGAGFLRAGARAVFAEGWRDPNYILKGLFQTNRTMREIFWSSPRATRSYASSFGSSRTSGMSGLLDPYYSGGYYRSVVGNLNMTASQWR